MPKRKKKIKKSVETNLKETDLSQQIKNLSNGLYYISETDAEVLPFVGKKSQSVTLDELKNQIESANKSHVEEKDFKDFFARLTEIQDWFGEEEKATARKFSDLKIFLEKNLKQLKVYKIGKVQIDIYVVGLDAENNLVGIKTKAVET